jgi:hypothetical protein
MQCARHQLLHYTLLSVAVCLNVYLQTCLPRGFLAKKEVGIADTKSDLIPGLANVTISKWLQSRKEERRRSGKMRDCETNVGNGHYVTGGESRERNQESNNMPPRKRVLANEGLCLKHNRYSRFSGVHSSSRECRSRGSGTTSRFISRSIWLDHHDAS